MRLFVAVIPPRPVVLELRAALMTLPHDNPRVRWCRPETWHVTLAFLGDVPQDALADLTERLGRAAARNTPMELALAGGGHFNGRTLWTGVQGDRDRLGRLAESVNSVARRCHIKVDERPFRPHLTLARVRDPGSSAGSGPDQADGVRAARELAGGAAICQERPADLQPYVDRMAAFRTPRWLVGEIDLFNVIDDPSKRYERIGRWALTGR
ncbi:RNA 2',3'-cyclic phosphodiesterase [Actinocrinis puniceicyclus]|uniref:RNA 2',3'-cyclic phosphodiesterase n=1 Tax=Actinocrinis puniceicyclus TaxID=977794 RepID=A0A8J7WHU1_9ACTN|nr:RNA 2',3'-cyclic phosphodiesterase [Actinocrinis puniceicyclus]MBS2962521.1 RNA 2',3'-cyclic phosphodiesterase [Actinocrinis puniceicyclus]